LFEIDLCGWVASSIVSGNKRVKCTTTLHVIVCVFEDWTNLHGRDGWGVFNRVVNLVFIQLRYREVSIR